MRNTPDTADLPIPPQPGYVLMSTSDPYTEHIGPLWVRVGDGRASALLRVQRCHTNANGSLHGGVLMTVMDVALGLSLDHALRQDDPGSHFHAITMQLSCSLVGAGAVGDLLVADTTLDRLTRSMGFASGRIVVGERLLMTGSGLFKRPSPHRSARP